MADEAGLREPAAFSLATTSSRKRKRALSRELLYGPMLAAEDLPDSTCPVCLNLGNEVWDPSYRKMPKPLFGRPQHLKLVRDVVIAARQGCSGCEIVAWALGPYVKQIEEEEGAAIEVYAGSTEVLSLDRLRYFGSKPYESKHVMKMMIKSTSSASIRSGAPRSKNVFCPWRFMEPISLPISFATCHTGSSAALEKVRKWYSECHLSHNRCRMKSRVPLPTRVVHIQGPNKVRLYISGAGHASYACLSHCWGGQSVIRTTTTTFKQYATDIPWEELSKTFQDAIQFAYSIGFTYLWIDSLCIIQDSIDDWRHEGSQMSQIYANASITLSATWAANPSQGCFAKLDQWYLPRIKTFKNRDHDTYELHCHEPLSDMKTPLFKRGWVFQERMLSRRVVHFMEQELWWECRECFQCECRSLDHRFYNRDYNIAIKLSQLVLLESIEKTWKQLVTTYSSKSLTYPSDIFPAIQALAKLVPSKMGRYLAGHWENTLISSLGWFASTPTHDRHMEWRAPSWSWAASQGHVHWPDWRHIPITTYATVLSALTIPKGDDPMGQISYGFIILRGKLLTGEMQEPEKPSDHGLILEGERLDVYNGSKVTWDRICRGGVDNRILVLKLSGIDVSPHVNQSWLILKAVEGHEGEYMRMGMLQISIVAHSLNEAYTRAWNAINDKAVEMDVKII